MLSNKLFLGPRHSHVRTCSFEVRALPLTAPQLPVQTSCPQLAQRSADCGPQAQPGSHQNGFAFLNGWRGGNIKRRVTFCDTWTSYTMEFKSIVHKWNVGRQPCWCICIHTAMARLSHCNTDCEAYKAEIFPVWLCTENLCWPITHCNRASQALSSLATFYTNRLRLLSEKLTLFHWRTALLKPQTWHFVL